MAVRRPQVFRDRISPFELYDEQDFFERYRFSKAVSQYLCNSYVLAGYGRKDGRGHAIEDDLMVLTALRYYATGSMYREVADAHGISRATVSRAVSRVGNFLCESADQWIRMPDNPQELYNAAYGFQHKYHMPRCVGAVDGTHIELMAPAQQEALYVNRHGTHSLNVQASCDSDLLFTSIDTSRPGSAHDNFVFTNSTLGMGCAQGQLGNYFILGDSGYAQRPWVMTPFLRPRTIGEMRYNFTQRVARSVIERAFGRLKMRFRCLSKSGGYVQTSPIKAANLIMACSVLHNVAETARLPMPAPPQDDAMNVVPVYEDDSESSDDEYDNVAPARLVGNAAGIQARLELVRDVFDNN